MIAIRLLDGTKIFAHHYHISTTNIVIGDSKFYRPNETNPVFVEDSVMLSMDSIDVYFKVLIGEIDEEV